jgi:20S proteasome subunit alpha 7
VRCKDGIVFGVEKLLGSKMLVAGSGRRIHAIDEHVGAATAGLMPDARQLVTRAREECKAYRTNFGGVIPPRMLNDRMGSFVHLSTVYWYLRPIGAAMLVGGYDAEAKTHELYCVEPNGMAVRYFGYAIGEQSWRGRGEGEAGLGRARPIDERTPL